MFSQHTKAKYLSLFQKLSAQKRLEGWTAKSLPPSLDFHGANKSSPQRLLYNQDFWDEIFWNIIEHFRLMHIWSMWGQHVISLSLTLPCLILFMANAVSSIKSSLQVSPLTWLTRFPLSSLCTTILWFWFLIIYFFSLKFVKRLTNSLLLLLGVPTTFWFVIFLLDPSFFMPTSSCIPHWLTWSYTPSLFESTTQPAC